MARKHPQAEQRYSISWNVTELQRHSALSGHRQMLYALGWNRLVKYDFLGAPQIFPWSTSGVKDPSWIITFTTCLLIAVLDFWFDGNSRIAHFFGYTACPQTTFAWCHLLSLEKGHACISKHDQSPKMHPTLPRSAFCSGGHRFLGRFWDATCA